MRILVVSDNYLQGGLENHLLIMTREGLSRGDEFYFAFANYLPCGDDSIDEHIVCTLKSPNDMTVENLRNDVEALVRTIGDIGIDAIHAHPFLSFLPAAIASQKSKAPLVFTSHATHSYNFPGSPIEALLFQQALSNVIAHVFAVNIECLAGLSTYYPETPVSYLPNPITHSDTVDISKRIALGEWALASRLDNDKVPGIKHVLEWLPELPIKALHIYGDGEARNMLAAYCDSLGIADMIIWHGFQPNWLQEAASSDIMGIIGSDRVALEACAMGFPVLLITLNSLPCGIMNIERYIASKNCNFNGSNLIKLDNANELSKEISSIESTLHQFQEIAELAKKDYSVKTVYDNYSEILRATPAKPGTGFVEFLDCLLKQQSYSIWDRVTLQAFAETLLTDVTNPLVFNTFLFTRDKAFVDDEWSAKYRNLHSALESQGKQIEAIRKELKSQRDTQKDAAKLNKKLAAANEQLEKMRSSRSWKLGRALTYPARYAKKIFRKLAR